MAPAQHKWLRVPFHAHAPEPRSLWSHALPPTGKLTPLAPPQRGPGPHRGPGEPGPGSYLPRPLRFICTLRVSGPPRARARRQNGPLVRVRVIKPHFSSGPALLGRPLGRAHYSQRLQLGQGSNENTCRKTALASQAQGFCNHQTISITALITRSHPQVSPRVMMLLMVEIVAVSTTTYR